MKELFIKTFAPIIQYHLDNKEGYGNDKDRSCKLHIQNKVSYKILYPRTCDKCKHTYKSKQSFFKHKKICATSRAKKDTYPKICGKCDKEFLCYRSFIRHEKECAASYMSSARNKCSRRCEKCGKEYLYRLSFCRHEKVCTRTTSERVKQKSVRNSIKMAKTSFIAQCSRCKLAFLNPTSFARHTINRCKFMTKFHIRCIHQDCHMFFRTHMLMVTHLSRHHVIDDLVQDIRFCSLQEFYQWRDEQQICKYWYTVKNSGVKIKAKVHYHYYVCHFNIPGSRRTFIKPKTSRRRTAGKVPYCLCPARMLVHVTDTDVHVKYVSKHNHELSCENIKWQRLPRNVKHIIRHSLQLGINKEKIRRTLIQDAGMAEGYRQEELSIVDLVTMKHIRQIEGSWKKSKRPHENDAISADRLIHSLNDSHPGSILVYKPQFSKTEIGYKDLDMLPESEKLFAVGIQRSRQREEMKSGCQRILCVDTTHRTNQYDFYLINFVVRDEYGHGYPVAHFITNYVDCNTLICLFGNIKRCCPDLTVQTIMTDDDPALFNALLTTFPGGRHVLCKWHIVRAWKKNIYKRVLNENVRKEIFNCLMKLLNTHRTNEFDSIENKLMLYKPIAPDFVNYYIKEYQTRREKWALCFRNFPHGDTDTNMLCESFHNIIKTHYFNRKQNRLLYDLIRVLWKIECDYYLRKSGQKLLKVASLDEVSLPGDRHYRGMRIPDLDVNKMNESTWSVKSQSLENCVYCIQVLSDKCLFPDHCYHTCSSNSCLDLCCHMYHCECPDGRYICKHIHKLHSYLIRNNSVIICGVPSTKEISSVSENLINTTGKKMKSRVTLLNSLEQGLTELNEKLENVYDKMLSKKTPHDNVAPSNLSPTIHFPPNVHFQTQLRFARTRKSIQSKKPAPNVTKVKNSAEVVHKTQFRSSVDTLSFTEPIYPDQSLTAPLFYVRARPVSVSDIKTLDPHIPRNEVNALKAADNEFVCGWLNDIIIDAFLQVCIEGHPDLFVVDCSIAALLSHFDENDVAQVINTILNSRITFIPCHISNHWILLVVRTNGKVIEVYDPLHESDTSMTDETKSCIQLWTSAITKADKRSWQTTYPTHAMQQDGSACGVFVCWLVSLSMSTVENN